MPPQVTIDIPPALRPYTEGLSEVQITADTVRTAIQGLILQYPLIKEHLLAEGEILAPTMNIFVDPSADGEFAGLDTRTTKGALVRLVPSGEVGKRPLPDLTKAETAFYSRHIILPELGLEGQKKLKKSRVLLVGAGGLGAPLGLYLAAAGVGTIGIVDFDVVEESNLQRQIIHSINDLGRTKTASARDRMLSVNPHIDVRPFDMKLSSANALSIFKDFDVIVDGSDNFPTRYLINDACALLGKPNVYGSIFRFEGLATVFDTRKGSCLRCTFPKPPAPGLAPSCGEGGVLGVLPGIIGSIQASETIKYIVGGGAPLVDRLLTVNAWSMRFHEIRLQKNPDCPLCGMNPTIKELMDYEDFCGIRKRPAETDGEAVETITPIELKKLLEDGGNIQIIDIRLPEEAAVSSLPNARSIPLAQLFFRMEELDPSRDAILVCKKGENSKDAIYALREEGYQGRLLNLQGGINAWAQEIDPNMAQY